MSRFGIKLIKAKTKSEKIKYLTEFKAICDVNVNVKETSKFEKEQTKIDITGFFNVVLMWIQNYMNNNSKFQ